MKKTLVAVMLCLSVGLGFANAQLRVDFSQTGDPVQADYQGYFADHEAAASFTAQSFAAFGTTVTIAPSWAAGATPQAMQMIDRGGDDGTDTPDLLRDWIGTDGRQPGNPMTLTVSGLPPGNYEWTSYHHDPEDQTGIFSVTVNDASGSTTTADIDISDTREGGIVNLAEMTTFTTEVAANGVDDVTFVFELTSGNTPVSTAFFLMNGFELVSLDTGQALLPVPPHGATDVPADDVVLSWTPANEAITHDVYFGTDAEAIGAATTADALYLGRFDANNLEVGALELGQTYHWRVDEVMAGGAVVAGNIWSFTAEPVGVPLAGDRIMATASSSNNADAVPGKTIDGSGLNEEGEHSTETADMWISHPDDPNAAWIQYEFDKVYRLHQMLVWNHNSELEPLVGFGIKEATLSFSLDGSEWTDWGTEEFARATGEGDYQANTTVEFDGLVAARYVRITAESNWGGALPQYGLSEVRFLVIPLFARQPDPSSGATEVDPQLVLDWRAGREAASHDVYLSVDPNAVIDGTALFDTVSEPGLDVSAMLELGRTYYWKVNEVNDLEDPAVWEGDLWDFSTVDSLIIDGMESYDDVEGQGTQIFETWVDGWDVPENGSQVGHDVSPFAEQTIVHGGSDQSMPFYYDNTSASYSEAARTFDDPQDWTRFGAQALTLWFFGDPSNAPAQMYVKVNGSKVVYGGDADNVRRKPWQVWHVDLSRFSGADLSAVTEMAIGFEGGGGQGLVFFDDIALSPSAGEPVAPVEPDPAGLVAHYAFEGDLTDSTGSHPGAAVGEPQFVSGMVGQAIQLDGARDYVMIESEFELPVYSAALWFRVDGGTGERDVLSVYDSTGAHGILLEVRPDSSLRFLHRAPLGTGGGTDIFSDYVYDDGGWYHAALVKSADTATLYVDGIAAGSSEDATEFGQALQRLTLGVLKHDNLIRYLPGAVDEVYLYDRALSPAEVAWLAGRTQPFDRP